MLYDRIVLHRSGNRAGMRAVLDACETHAARPMGSFHEDKWIQNRAQPRTAKNHVFRTGFLIPKKCGRRHKNK